MLRYSFLEIIRNKKRTLLLFFVSLLLSAFMGSYFGSIDNMKQRLEEVYQTIPVTGEIIGRNTEDSVTIPYDVIRWVLNTGFIKSSNLQLRDYAFIIDPLIGRIKSDSKETWPEIVGVYSFDQMPWYTGITIEYAEGYSALSFCGSEQICLISESDMADKDIHYGDKIRILASEYYKKYSSLEEMRGVSFTVCGQYSMDGAIDGECNNIDLSEQQLNGGIKGDMLVPVNTMVNCMRQLYDDVIPELELTKKTIVDQVGFTFQNTRNLKDFRAYLSKTDFGRKSYEVQDQRLANLEFRLYDEQLNEVVTPLTHSLKILTSSVGLVLLIIGLIACFIAYLSLKAGVEQLWIMRSVGRKTGAIFVSLLIELSLPCIISAIIAYLIGTSLFRTDAVLPYFFFAGCYISGCICFIYFTLLKPMTILLRDK